MGPKNLSGYAAILIATLSLRSAFAFPPQFPSRSSPIVPRAHTKLYKLEMAAPRLFKRGPSYPLRQLRGLELERARGVLFTAQEAMDHLIRGADGRGANVSNLDAIQVAYGSPIDPLAFGTGDSPNFVVSVDLNSDGKLDLVSADSLSASLTILMGDGSGSFQRVRNLTTGNSPTSVVAADLNLDGIVDLVSADSRASQVSLFLGNGDGTFRRPNPESLLTRNKPLFLLASDLNADGNLDLVSGDADAGQLSIFLGLGDGTFGPRTPLIPLSVFTPRCIADSDVNLDGFVDLIAAESAGNRLSISPGLGDGTFRTNVSPIPTGQTPYFVIARDLDANGIPDLISADRASNSLSVFLGNGNATFHKPNPSALPTGMAPTSIASADLNGDAFLDLVSADSGPAQLSIFLGAGNGTFRRPTPPVLSTGKEPNAVLANDLSGDGAVDLASADSAADQVSIFLGLGNGSFRHSLDTNEVILQWSESTTNPDGVRVLIDGILLGVVPGLSGDSLPGSTALLLTGIAAGQHVFRLEGAGTNASKTLNVLNKQPFSDVTNLQCASGAFDPQTGLCNMAVSWATTGPPPNVLFIFADGLFSHQLAPNSNKTDVTGLLPGTHCVEVIGFLSDSQGSYMGSQVETCCDLSCEDQPCSPPVALKLCQVAYGPGAEDNAILASWTNGENPYLAGLNAYADASFVGTLPGDTQSAIFGLLSPRAHTIGVEGLCGPLGSSPIAQQSMELLTQTPHMHPVDGTIICNFDPALAETTVHWTSADLSTSIDVYLLAGQDLLFVGSLPGDLNSFTITNTSPNDAIALQFFTEILGTCYGSELLTCTPTLGPTDTIQDFDLPGTPYTLTNFAGTPPILLPGGPTGNFLRLADQSSGVLNTIAFSQSALGQYPQIVAEFDFRILPTSLSRADGFGFVLLNTLVFGKTGAGPQITELPSLSKSFGVGFDIFKNAGEPSNNHIRLTFDGAQVADVNINQQTLDLADGLFHHATILLDFLQNGTNLTVTLDTSVTPISKHFIQGMRSYESRVAFGARTGGEFAHHDLDNIKVSFIKQTLLPFHRGDSDNNGQLQLTDAVRILGYLFLGQTAPTCLDAADADGNNQLQLTDAVRILGYLFLGQAAPAAPGPPPSPCGTDNDDTHVGCDAYTNC